MNRLLVLLLIDLIQPCNSKEVPCATKQTQNGTCYTIQRTSASGCSYSWSNKTDHNLAVEGGKMDQLVNFSNITVLITYKCHERIKYTRNCPSEKEKTTGICIMNCTTPSPQGASGPSGNYWKIPVITIASITCGLLLVAGILCKVFNLHRKRHPHTPVNGDDLDNNMDNNLDLRERAGEV